MSTQTKTDKIRSSIRFADDQAGASTRTHISAIMRDEGRLLNQRKAESCKCQTCRHISTKGYFSLCTLKDKLVNSLALCHKWAAKV